MSYSPFIHYVTYRFIRDESVAGAKKGDTDYTMREREREREKKKDGGVLKYFKSIDGVVETLFF